jgi:cytochrome b
MEGPVTTPPRRHRIRLWDLPTRLFHWALVVLIALQFASGEFGVVPMRWHYLLGYATLALIVFRVLWGFAGSQTSRFGSFVRGPRAVVRYVAASLRGRAPRAPGHNPLGGWSALVMLVVVVVQAVSGLFASDDISEEGPFAAHVSDAIVALMTRIHHIDRYVLVVLIALHVGAVLLHWAIRNDNLVAPMLHGRAQIDGAREPRFVSSWRALGLFALSAGAVWALVAWAAAG